MPVAFGEDVQLGIAQAGQPGEPSDFGTLEFWIDPRYEITHSGDGTAVTAWNDHGPNSYAGTITGAPIYEATGWNSNMPSVKFDGVTDGFSFLAATGASAFASGDDKPIYVVAAMEVLTVQTSADDFFGFFHSGTPTNNRYRKLSVISSNRFYPGSRDDSLTVSSQASGVNANTTVPRIVTWAFEGTTISLYLDGVVDPLISSFAQDVGTTTLDQFGLAHGHGSVPQNNANVRFGPVLVYSALKDRRAAEEWIAQQFLPSFSDRATNYVDSGKILQYVRADIGYGRTATIPNQLAALEDQGASALHYAQATVANQPQYHSFGGPNKTAAIQLDTAARNMTASLDLPATSVTPTTMWLVFRQDSWIDGRSVLTGGGANDAQFWQRGAGPNTMRLYHGVHTTDNAGAALGTWVRGIGHFSNSVNDYQLLGSTKTTGINAGNQNAIPSPRYIGGPSNASALVTVSELLYIEQDLSAYEYLRLEDYVARRYQIGSTNSVPSPSALDNVAAGKVLQYVRADVGITKDGSNRISEWKDQFAGRHYTQGTGANQPLFLPTDGPNGTAAVQIDGAARFLQASLALPPGGVFPVFIWAVIRQDAFTIGNRLISDSTSSKFLLYQHANGSPTMAMYDNVIVNPNTAAAIGSWVRAEVAFTNSSADYLKLGSTNSTGANAGSGVGPGDVRLGDASIAARGSIAEVLYLNALPTANEKTALDAYVTSRYGAGLV